MFARSEFDLGDFMALVHEIDTKTAPCQGKDAEDPGFFRRVVEGSP